MKRVLDGPGALSSAPVESVPPHGRHAARFLWIRAPEAPALRCRRMEGLSFRSVCVVTDRIDTRGDTPPVGVSVQELQPETERSRNCGDRFTRFGCRSMGPRAASGKGPCSARKGTSRAKRHRDTRAVANRRVLADPMVMGRFVPVPCTGAAEVEALVSTPPLVTSVWTRDPVASPVDAPPSGGPRPRRVRCPSGSARDCFIVPHQRQAQAGPPSSTDGYGFNRCCTE